MKSGDLAYFAGLMDGEAHIGLLRTKRTDRDGQMRFIPRIIISMLKKEHNENVLVRLHQLIGGSLYIRKPWEYKDRVRITHREQVALELRNLVAFNALKLLQPFLRIKNIHADLILGLNFRARFRVSPDEAKKREEVYWQIRHLNDGKKL